MVHPSASNDRWKYPLAFVILFLIEIAIALFVHDEFIRPLVGDMLVVILIYCLVRSIWKVTSTRLCLGILIFAYGIEIGQYFQLANRLGLGNNVLARIVIGSTFDWKDLGAYAIGIGCIYLLEHEAS